MKSLKFFLLLFSFSSVCYSQSINCPNNSVYIQSGGQIIEQPLPLPAPSTTLLTGLPAGANGLAIGPPLGFVAPNPTFWTVASGTYWYYNGSSWVNTTHSPGNAGAVNIGSGGSCLYNLVGSTGQIYVYNGTGNGTLLTTITGFGGGGPYDIGADMNDNFYLVKATVPNPALIVYDPTGMPICSYSLANLPAVSSGGGFAIINNLIAVYNSGFSLANINPVSPQITFTTQSAIVSPIDFANCVIGVPTGSIGAPLGTVLNCANLTLPITAEVVPGGIGMAPGPPSSTLTSGTYTWSGPGIVTGQNTATITVNQPGIYTFTVFSNGCPSQKVSKSIVISGAGVPLTPIISAPSCFYGPSTLSVSANIPFSGITWAGPGITQPATATVANISSAGNYTVTLTNTLGCMGTATMNVQAPPSVTAALSSSSLCAQGSNGSPNTLTITPSGGISYSLVPGSNCSYSGTGPFICSPSGVPAIIQALATATVLGSNGTCVGSTAVSFVIVPNPSITITPSVSGVCSGFSKTLSVSGAASYSWLPGQGLSTLQGANLVATPFNTAVYSAFGSNQGCNSATNSSTLNVIPIPTVFANALNSTVCAGYAANLSASGTANSFTWSFSGGPAIFNGPSVNVNVWQPVTTFTVTGSLNSCTSIATATIATVAPPTVLMVFDTGTVCAQAINGSPNTINVTPSGAANYTLLSGSNFNVSSPSSAGMSIFTMGGTPQSAITIATATLLGSNGYCQVATTKNFTIFPNPVVTSLPGSAVLCPGESLLLNASGANNYSWTAGGSNPNVYTGLNLVATPTVTTIYSVIGESMGCRSVAQVNIVTLSQVPNVSISAASPTLCAGKSVLLSATGNATSYKWLSGNGQLPVSGGTFAVAPTSSRAYTLVGAINTCTSSAVASLSVIQSPNLVASASAYTICSGANVHLYASGANSYNWAPSTGPNPLNGQNVIASPSNPTTFTVSGFNGVCTGTATVFVKTVANPNMKIDAPYHQICAGGIMPVRVSGAQKYLWMPPAGLSSASSDSVIASPQVSTNYTIAGFNSEGNVSCAELITYSITVLPYAKAIISPVNSICAGDNVYLSVSGGSNYRWWPAATLNKAEGSMVLAKPAVSTVYFVEASFSGNCSTTNTIGVTVNPNPVVYAGRDTTFNLDEVMSITSNGTGTLKWISGDNISCSDCPHTQISPRFSSCYIVEAVNSFGCKRQDEVCIKVTDDFYQYLPNSFTPNNDGLNDVFFIFGSGLSNVKMEIYDRWGELLFRSADQTNGWDGTFKGLDCQPGAYTYRISYKGLNGRTFEKAGTVNLIR